MKKLMLVAGTFAAMVVSAPTTPASAERPSVMCTVAGSATFAPENLRPVPQLKLGYEFHGSAECETLPAREKRTGTVEVTGEETLSCAGSLGEAEGKGVLTLAGMKLPFGLTFVGGTPGSTGVAAKFADGGIASGTATFLGSSNAFMCFVPKGAHELTFKGTAIGEL